MTKQYVKIHNVETDEIIEREMTAEELQDYQAKQSEQAAEIAKFEANATARQAILDRLGLTAEEAALLLK